MNRIGLKLLAATVALAAFSGPVLAEERHWHGRGWNNGWHEGWRGNGWRGGGIGVVIGPPVIYAPPRYYYPPPPVVYAAPPPVYDAPPPVVVAPAPSLSFGATIPLH